MTLIIDAAPIVAMADQRDPLSQSILGIRGAGGLDSPRARVS